MEIEKSRKDNPFGIFQLDVSLCSHIFYGGGHDRHPDHPERLLLNPQVYNGAQHGRGHQNQQLP